jgi:hypothetical protein
MIRLTFKGYPEKIINKSIIRGRITAIYLELKIISVR